MPFTPSQASLNEVETIVDPPPEPFSTMRLGESITIAGFVERVDNIKEVITQGMKKEVKEIVLASEQERANISLWSTAAQVPLNCGEKLKIIRGKVAFSKFKGCLIMHVNEAGQLKKLEDDTTVKEITIDGCSLEGQQLAIATEDGGEFLLDDSTAHDFASLEEAATKMSEQLPYQAVVKLKGNVVVELM